MQIFQRARTIYQNAAAAAGRAAEALRAEGLGFEYVFGAFAAAFMAAGLYITLWLDEKFTGLTFVNKVKPLEFFMVFLAVFAILLALQYRMRRKVLIPRALMVLMLAFFLVLIDSKQSDVYFNCGLALIVGCAAWWAAKDDKLGFSGFKIDRRHCMYVAVACFAVYTAVVAYFTILRYLSYSASTFDFGIFTQMFESMRKTGLPDTTLERSVLMSHFGVHFSPVYYLLLPGYILFPCPQYLLIAQAAAVGAGVFAVNGICKQLELSPKMTVAFNLLYILLPSMAGGAFYDFHENKFLAVLIL
ncbi:MAG: DUF2079 domain-containing protein, partial [Oscillospiraceae bacterium]|nr:DUF2079 domain-containing protein [Oscillospiraceae bacterium]